MSENRNLTAVKVEDIDLADTTYQYRDSLDDKAIADYAKVDPGEFSQPIELLAKGGSKYTILSGHHRVRAFVQAGRTEINARVYKDLKESAALIKSIQANSKHGVRVTVAEKKKACQKLLLQLEKEDRSVSDSQIAKYTGLSDPTVEKYRQELVAEKKLKDAAVRTDAAGRDRPAKKKKTKPEPSPVDLFKSKIRELAEQAATIDTSELAKLPIPQRKGIEAELGAYFDDIRKVIDSAGAQTPPEGKDLKVSADAA